MKKNIYQARWFLEDPKLAVPTREYLKKASALRQLKRLHQKGFTEVRLGVWLVEKK